MRTRIAALAHPPTSLSHPSFAQLLTRRARSHANVLRPLECIRIDPLNHSLDLLQWADLEEVPDALHDHRLHGGLPEDLVGELHLHKLDEGGRIRARRNLLTGDVEVNGALRWRHLILQVLE